MPNSLWDLWGGDQVVPGGQDFGSILAQNRNSLVGLGLGLASGGLPAGLQGYQAGSTTDAATQYRMAQMKQHQQELALRRQEAARQAEQWKQSFGLQQQQFERGAPELQPAPTRERFDPTLGRNVIDEFDRQTRSWKPATAPSVAGPAAAPVDPFTAGAGRSVYGTGGNYAAPAAPAAPAAGMQATPVMPPQKPLSAHEQGSVEKAEDLVLANKGAIGSLQQAKELSRKAASGPFALQRGQAGSMLSGTMFGEGGTETVMLDNIVRTNALEGLKAAFGNNPTEGERKILLEVQGSVNQPDAVRQQIYDRAIQAANDRLQLNAQRAQQIRGGTYYRPGGGQQAPAAAPAPTAGSGVRRYNPATGKIE